MTQVTLDQRDVMRSLTLDIRITGRAHMRVRIWLAIRLLRLAARALGCQVKVDADLRS